ncbi:hypothetical protein [Nocardia sp. NPDC052566]|uniref:hypothetical protein n=1 Tax=Nocardia sp. NPDC052566 TaxID=3364330 RepID=UPI0037C69E89
MRRLFGLRITVGDGNPIDAIAPGLITCMVQVWLISDRLDRQGRHSPRSMACNAMIDFVKQHPKGSAWSGLVFGVLGFAGGIMQIISPDPANPENPAGGMVLAAVIAAGCGFLLLRWRTQEIAAKSAEIVARADAQHQAYLAGDDFGLYGTRDRPEL